MKSYAFADIASGVLVGLLLGGLVIFTGQSAPAISILTAFAFMANGSAARAHKRLDAIEKILGNKL